MKNFLFQLYMDLMKFGAHFTKMQNNKIVVLNGAGRSGSNGYLFAKYLKTEHPEYEVSVIEPWPSSHLSFATWREIGRAKFVLTTHQPFKIRKKQVNIQFWHGIPLKRMGIMAKNTNRKTDLRNENLWQNNTDVVTSTSDLYETLMSSCCAIETNKYQKVGFPRLDSLQHPVISKEQLMQDLFKTADEQAQVGIYLPTFRYEIEDNQAMAQLKNGNFLTVPDFDAEKLNSDLKQRHQYLLVKLHPYEMRLFSHLSSQFSNIAFLNNDYLLEHDYDLYELLGDTDFLITDFSSVYFDYLSLNKPIIFITNYLKQYEKARGLLIGPYEQVVPGICVKNQEELQTALGDPDNYHSQRKYWLDLTNQIQGHSYCNDVFTLMTTKY